jgi:UDP-2,3-diacylglucosamine pyrophosphatase LpxH
VVNFWVLITSNFTTNTDQPSVTGTVSLNKEEKKGKIMKDKLVGRPIRCNRKTLKVKRSDGFAQVILLGDVHLGSPQCDIKRFLGMLDYCLKNHVYVLLMGDLVEVGTKTSVGAGVYEQEFNGESQVEQMIEYLRPLAEAKLILGVHTGNHEERTYKESGVNVTKAIARELKLSYLGDACWNEFRVGKEKYLVYSLHGRSGARFDGTALLAIERISVSFFCDVVAHAHLHKVINSIVLMQKVVRGQVVEHKKHLIACGGFVKYDGSYAQTFGMPIAKLGSPKVKFYSNRHDLLVSW